MDFVPRRGHWQLQMQVNFIPLSAEVHLRETNKQVNKLISL